MCSNVLWSFTRGSECAHSFLVNDSNACEINTDAASLLFIVVVWLWELLGRMTTCFAFLALIRFSTMDCKTSPTHKYNLGGETQRPVELYERLNSEIYVDCIEYCIRDCSRDCIRDCIIRGSKDCVRDCMRHCI